MKHLFGTEDLEAEVFADQNYDIDDTDRAEEDVMSVLERIAEGDMDAFPSLELTLELEDGRSLVYETFGVFVHGDKEYVALHPKTDDEGMIHLMELVAGENDEINLLPIPEDEWDAVAETFHVYFDENDDEFDEEDGEEDYDRD